MRHIWKICARLAAVGALAIVGRQAAIAQAYPNKPVRFVLPLNAGGMADTLFRPTAEAFSARIGVPVIVENRLASRLRRT